MPRELHMKRALAGLGLISIFSLFGTTSQARACGIDGVPSMSANGHLVTINRAIPVTAAELQRYTPFVFRGDFLAGRSINLEENRKEVEATLVSTALARPLRWSFGDGSTGYGWNVHHAYTRSGHWHVGVEAYFPSTKQWYPLDKATIIVVSVSPAASA